VVIKITTKLDSRFHGNDSNDKYVFAKSAGGERSEDDLVKIKLKNALAITHSQWEAPS
jgi:hypothetical protein